MNPAAALRDLQHPNSQCLTDGAATLARANQSDRSNFPGSEPISFSEKTHPGTRTPDSALTGKVLTYLPRAKIRRPPCVEQTAPCNSIPGFVVAGNCFGDCGGFGDYIAKPADMFRITHFNPIGVHDVFPRSVGPGMFAFDRIGPSIHSRRSTARFASAPLMPVLENAEQPGRSGDDTTVVPFGSGRVLS